MSENDVLAVLVVAAATVRLTGLLLRYRSAQKTAARKAKEAQS